MTSARDLCDGRRQTLDGDRASDLGPVRKTPETRRKPALGVNERTRRCKATPGPFGFESYLLRLLAGAVHAAVAAAVVLVEAAHHLVAEAKHAALCSAAGRLGATGIQALPVNAAFSVSAGGRAAALDDRRSVADAEAFATLVMILALKRLGACLKAGAIEADMARTAFAVESAGVLGDIACDTLARGAGLSGRAAIVGGAGEIAAAVHAGTIGATVAVVGARVVRMVWQVGGRVALGRVIASRCVGADRCVIADRGVIATRGIIATRGFAAGGIAGRVGSAAWACDAEPIQGADLTGVAVLVTRTRVTAACVVAWEAAVVRAAHAADWALMRGFAAILAAIAVIAVPAAAVVADHVLKVAVEVQV
ncbi:MAG: hypothetical protein ACI9MR_000669, partial [Myxococcota bacterium]